MCMTNCKQQELFQHDSLFYRRLACSWTPYLGC